MRLKKDFWHLGLACLSLGCVLATVKSEKDAEVDQLQTQQDFNNPKVRGGCPLSGQFRSKDTRCWVRSVPPSSPQNAGENSYCRVVSGPKPGLYSCKQGTWIPAVPNIEKPSNRGKRGWWWWGGRSRQPKPKKPPNKPPYFTYCPSDIQETARPNENDAVATFTVQADDKEGKATLTVNQGKKSGSRFPEGLTYVRYTATDSQGLTASCTFWVTVKVRRCPRVAELAKFPHGSQRCSGTEKDIYGSHCRHTCLPGYTLRGPTVVTCLSSSSWSSDFPSCKAVSCGNPGQVAHGFMVCPKGHSYEQLCIVHCDKGYENVGVRFPTCGRDGQWIPQYSHCRAQKKRNAVEQGEESVVREDTPPQRKEKPLNRAKKGWWWGSSSTPTPPPPPPPPNQAPYFTSCPADINVTAPADQKDAIVTFSVQAADKEGHVTLTLNQGAGSGSRFREGETFVSYSAIDTGGLTASCSFHVRVTATTCPPPSVDHGSFVCPSGYQHPAQCELSCDEGFQVQAPDQIQCLENVTWSATGSCKEDKCPIPAAPKNGALSCHLGTLGTICQVSCSQDWDLTHSLTDHLSCINERGTWSSDVNVVETGCVKRRRPTQQNSKANVHYFAGSCNSSTEELRQAYVTRMQGSALKDACTGVPSCTAKNVKVFCGPIWPSQAERRKRGAGNERASPEDKAALRGAFFQRGGYRRLNSTHYYHKDSSDVHVPFAEGEQFPGRTFQTPDGQMVKGTLYREGLFQLLLPNPVLNGTYTCRISPSTNSVSCAHGDDQRDSVDVDGWSIRLALLEAQQHRLVEENAKKDTASAHKDAVISQLAATVQTLRAELTYQSTQVDTVRVDLSRTQTEVRNLSSSVQAVTDHTPPAVAFTARLSRRLQLAHGAPLILSDVLVNDGGAYDTTTGRFTAPVDGTYVFSAMTTPYGSPQSAGLALIANSAAAKSGGRLFASAAHRDSGELSQSASLQGAVRLQRGDQVWLTAQYISLYSYSEFTAFSGFLLYVE